MSKARTQGEYKRGLLRAAEMADREARRCREELQEILALSPAMDKQQAKQRAADLRAIADALTLHAARIRAEPEIHLDRHPVRVAALSLPPGPGECRPQGGSPQLSRRPPA